LRQRQTSLWDLLTNVRLRDSFMRLRPRMLPDDRLNARHPPLPMNPRDARHEPLAPSLSPSDGKNEDEDDNENSSLGDRLRDA